MEEEMIIEMIVEMIIEVITLTETHCFQVFKRLCATNPAVITTVFQKYMQRIFEIIIIIIILLILLLSLLLWH